MNEPHSTIESNLGHRFALDRQPSAGDDQLLLVDDSTELANMLVETLRCWGYGVISASSLQGARRTISESQLALVLCNDRLPDGNGLELLAWLRFDRRTNLPFVLMSGYAAFASERRRDYKLLRKPFAPHNLRKVLQQVRCGSASAGFLSLGDSHG